MANNTNPQALPTNPTLPSAQPVATVFDFFVSGPRDVWQGDRGFLSLDASISVTHSSEVQVTEHPVEQGQDVTDNARPKPDSLMIEGFISGTPIGPSWGWYRQGEQVTDIGNQAPIDPLEPGPGRAKEAFDLLRSLKDNATLINVTTDLNNYQNMVIETLSFPQDSATGDSLRFTAKLRGIKIIQSKSVVPQVTKTLAAGKSKKGNKTGDNATDADANKTGLLIGLQKVQKHFTGTNSGLLQ